MILRLASQHIFFNKSRTMKGTKLLHVIYKTGFRCYTTNSRASRQAGTCFMLSLEVWPWKPFSQGRIQGQEKKKKPHLLGSYSNKPGGRAAPEQLGSRPEQSRTLAALGEQPPLKLGALRSNINFLELSTLLLSKPGGNTERVRAVLAQEAQHSTSQARGCYSCN